LEIPGTYIWMGTSALGSSRTTDLCFVDYNPDEGCIRDAVKALAATVLTGQELVPA
jgi:hypothetical protein